MAKPTLASPTPGKMSFITLITPAGVHPPWQMVWKTSTTPERPRQTLTVRLWRLPSRQQTTLSQWHAWHSRTRTHSCAHHHACFLHGWQASCRLWLISWKDVVCDLALITLYKCRVCHAILHMLAGIRLFLNPSCLLEAFCHHSWTLNQTFIIWKSFITPANLNCTVFLSATGMLSGNRCLWHRGWSRQRVLAFWDVCRAWPQTDPAVWLYFITVSKCVCHCWICSRLHQNKIEFVWKHTCGFLNVRF